MKNSLTTEDEVIKSVEKTRHIRQMSKNREEHLLKLRYTVMTKYGYNEYLTDALMKRLPETEIIEMLEANTATRPSTIRTNRIKTCRKELVSRLLNRGINLDPQGTWCNVGLLIYESTVPLTSTPEYMAGHFVIQSGSSFLACISLAPQIGETVVDIVSWTGAKSSHLSALMQNTGIIFINETKTTPLDNLYLQMQRLGVTNSVICNYDYPNMYKAIGTNSVDRVLLDPPSSETGELSTHSSNKVTKNQDDLWKCAQKQKQLLLLALDMVDSRSKSGGFVTYCTSSLMVEENESVLDYAIRKKNIQITQPGIKIGQPGFTRFRGLNFHPSIKNTVRIYPHIHNLDGYFLAKIKKLPQ